MPPAISTTAPSAASAQAAAVCRNFIYPSSYPLAPGAAQAARDLLYCSFSRAPARMLVIA